MNPDALHEYAEIDEGKSLITYYSPTRDTTTRTAPDYCAIRAMLQGGWKPCGIAAGPDGLIRAFTRRLT